MSLSILDHAVNVLLREGGTAGNSHGLLSTGALVLCGDVHNAVGVNIEGDLNLGYAARCGGDTGQLEGTQVLVVAGEFALTLEHLNRHGRLVVFSGREGLRTLGGNSGVALDQLGHHATLSFDTEGQRGHVDQQNVLAVALEHASLQGCTHCHNLIGVNTLVGLTTGEFLHQVSHGGHTGGTTHEHDLGNIRNLDACFLDNVLEGLLGAFEQIAGEVLKLCARELLVQVNRTFGSHREVLQRNVGAGCAGELLLSLLSCLLQTLQSDLVFGEVCTGLGLNLLKQPIHNALIPVVAAQAVVAASCAHLNGREAIFILANFKQGDVEGTAAKVEDQNQFVFFTLVQTVSQCSCGRLVHNAQNVQTRDLAGFLSSLALGVVEVCGNGDNRIGHLVVQVCFSIVLELLQNTCGNFLRGVFLAVNFRRPVGAHVALDGRDGAINVSDRLALCYAAHQNVAILGECDHGGGGAGAFSVRDNFRLATFKGGYDRVSGAEVNTNCTCHVLYSLVLCPASWRGGFLG